MCFSIPNLKEYLETRDSDKRTTEVAICCVEPSSKFKSVNHVTVRLVLLRELKKCGIQSVLQYLKTCQKPILDTQPLRIMYLKLLAKLSCNRYWNYLDSNTSQFLALQILNPFLF